MKDQHKQARHSDHDPHPGRRTDTAPSEDPGAADPHTAEPGMTAEEAEELVGFARSPDAEAPVGAESFLRALRIVADQRDENLRNFQRTAADFQNFQRRARQSERESRELASAGVVQSLLQVLDFFDMALKQDPEKATAAQVIGGVQMIKAEFLRILAGHGVGPVHPERGEEFDPTQHEAVEQAERTGVEPGHVVEVRTPGYRMGERVIRPAKVIVAVEPKPNSATPAGGEG